MSTSLVTGAAGFLGQALVRRLLAEGDVVRAVVLPGDPHKRELSAALHDEGDPLASDSTRSAAGPGEPAGFSLDALGAMLRAAGRATRLQVIEADIRDERTLSPAFAGVDRVFHAAALIHAWAPWSEFRAVNIDGTQNVARAALAHGVERLVLVSTTDVFGIPRADEVLDESCPLRPWGEPYADTKIEAERRLWDFHRQSGLAVSVIYPGWIYGPGDHAFFPSLAEAIEGGLMMFWRRDVKLPWVYVDNLVDAVLLASTQAAAAGKGFIVHDDSDGPTLQDVCARIAAVRGRPAPTRHVPYALAYGAAKALQTVWRITGRRTPPPLLSVDVKAFGFQWRLSTAKVRRELGWSPLVGIDDGMKRALDSLARLR